MLQNVLSAAVVIGALRVNDVQVGHSENRGSTMSAHVLLNSFNELGEKRKNARLVEHFISFSQHV